MLPQAKAAFYVRPIIFRVAGIGAQLLFFECVSMRLPVHEWMRTRFGAGSLRATSFGTEGIGGCMGYSLPP